MNATAVRPDRKRAVGNQAVFRVETRIIAGIEPLNFVTLNTCFVIYSVHFEHKTHDEKKT